MSTPPPTAPTSAAAPPGPAYQLASPAVKLIGVNAKLMAFVEYIALWHRLTFGEPLVITSGIDSLHVAGSLHAQGLAVDIRTKDLAADDQVLLLTMLAVTGPANKIAVFDERALGGEAHIHLEYHG